MDGAGAVDSEAVVVELVCVGGCATVGVQKKKKEGAVWAVVELVCAGDCAPAGGVKKKKKGAACAPAASMRGVLGGEPGACRGPRGSTAAARRSAATEGRGPPVLVGLAAGTDAGGVVLLVASAVVVAVAGYIVLVAGVAAGLYAAAASRANVAAGQCAGARLAIETGLAAPGVCPAATGSAAATEPGAWPLGAGPRPRVSARRGCWYCWGPC